VSDGSWARRFLTPGRVAVALAYGLLLAIVVSPLVAALSMEAHELAAIAGTSRRVTVLRVMGGALMAGAVASLAWGAQRHPTVSVTLRDRKTLFASAVWATLIVVAIIARFDRVGALVVALTCVPSLCALVGVLTDTNRIGGALTGLLYVLICCGYVFGMGLAAGLVFPVVERALPTGRAETAFGTVVVAWLMWATYTPGVLYERKGLPRPSVTREPQPRG
jgi:hypothetical protein